MAQNPESNCVMARRAQLLIDLDLDTSPIAGHITSDHHSRRPFYGWLELCSAIEAVDPAALAPSNQEEQRWRVHPVAGSGVKRSRDRSRR